MLSRAVLPRILSALFYHSEAGGVVRLLPALPELLAIVDLLNLCVMVALPDDDALTWQFSVLFEGEGKMRPATGIGYAEKDNLRWKHRPLSTLQSQGMVFAGREREAGRSVWPDAIGL